MTKSVLITGASGLVGTRLTEMLLAQGYQVRHLSRGAEQKSDLQVYQWNVRQQTADPKAFEGVDAVINLAGAGVADQRWTESRKQEILESRTLSTHLLARCLALYGQSVTTVVSASAIGYYGFNTGDALVTEQSPAGSDFLAGVTQTWEHTSDEVLPLGKRLVKLRIGIVLSKQGGAWPKLAMPVKFGLGAALGSGRQWMSWIHLDDLCRMFIHALEQPHVEGAYNAVAPLPVTNADFTKQAARALRKPLWLPSVPGFVMRAMLGEMSAMVLGGNKVSAQKITGTGFAFRHMELSTALKALMP